MAEPGHLSGITLFAPAVVLLLSGAASGHPHEGRFDWVAPPVLRGTEYLYLFALGHGPGVPAPLAFVLPAVVALHHCGVLCRARRGVRPPAWAMRARLGWQGRRLLVALGGAPDWLPFAYGALTGYLVPLVRETRTGWRTTPVTAVAGVPRNGHGGADASTT